MSEFLINLHKGDKVKGLSYGYDEYKGRVIHNDLSRRIISFKIYRGFWLSSFEITCHYNDYKVAKIYKV